MQPDMMDNASSPRYESQSHDLSRLSEIDALRGFALGGVVISNVVSASGFNPFAYPELVAGTGNMIVFQGILMLGIAGRFMGLFSLLFGIGFALMLQRATARGEPFAGRYFRRTVALFGIGIISQVLGNGDVLHLYALMAMVLLLFRNASDRTLIIAAIASLFVGGISGTVQPYLYQYLPSPRGLAAQELVVRQSGDLVALIQFRFAHLFARMWPSLLGSNYLTLFFAGVLIVRSGVLAQLSTHRRTLRRVFWSSVVLFPLAVAFSRLVVSPLGAWQPPFAMLAGVALYTSGFLLLWARGGMAQRLLSVLAPAGRMALTWYLSVPIVGWLVFDITGSVSRVDALTGTAIGAGLFAAMVLSSHWWLGHFVNGPVEWIWRAVTYGPRQFRRFIERFTPTNSAPPATSRLV